MRIETRRRVLIIIHVLYFISTFCWYIKGIDTLRKKYRMESFTRKPDISRFRIILITIQSFYFLYLVIEQMCQ